MSVFLLLSLAAPAFARSETITFSGHLNYPGPDDVFLSPEGANVSARYMGQEYFTTTDSNGDYHIGPITYGDEALFEFKINYTDPAGNYYIWPADSWLQTFLSDDGKLTGDAILIKSTPPVPTTIATATPTATATPSPTPTPTPFPSINTSISPGEVPTPTPVPTKTPSAFMGVIGSMGALALIGYMARKKL